jgi:hypothetical protein
MPCRRARNGSVVLLGRCARAPRVCSRMAVAHENCYKMRDFQTGSHHNETVRKTTSLLLCFFSVSVQGPKHRLHVQSFESIYKKITTKTHIRTISMINLIPPQ